MSLDIPDEPMGRASSSRLVVVAFVLVALFIAGYFALGMPGMDHSPVPAVDHGEMDM